MFAARQRTSNMFSFTIPYNTSDLYNLFPIALFSHSIVQLEGMGGMFSIVRKICQDESCAGREQERRELEEEETWLSMLLKCEDFKGQLKHLVKNTSFRL